MRDAKGRFVKRGGSRKARRSTALVRSSPRTITKWRTRTVKRARRRSARGGSSGVTAGKVILAGLGLGFLFGDKTPVPQARELVTKIPGAKTFGAPAMAGAVLLGVDRWVKPSPWFRAAGLVALGLAAAKVGEQGTDFKFVGDEDADDFVSDVE